MVETRKMPDKAKLLKLQKEKEKLLKSQPNRPHVNKKGVVVNDQDYKSLRTACAGKSWVDRMAENDIVSQMLAYNDHNNKNFTIPDHRIRTGIVKAQNEYKEGGECDTLKEVGRLTLEDVTVHYVIARFTNEQFWSKGPQKNLNFRRATRELIISAFGSSNYLNRINNGLNHSENSLQIYCI